MNWFSSHKAFIFLGLILFVALAASLTLSFKPIESTDVAGATGLSVSLKYLGAIIGFCIWFIFLRISDIVAGIKFKESYESIESNAIALSLYFGLRSVGAGLLLGMVLG